MYENGLTPADLRAVIGNNCGNNGGFGFGGGNFLEAIVALAVLGMVTGGDFFGNNNRNGTPATQADISAGFANSEIMSDLNNILLQNSQGFAGVQQTLCQGFSGVNQTVMSGFHGVDNAICTLGYQAQQGFSGIGAQMAQCCCETKEAIKDGTTQGIMNTGAIQRQIADCCCDLEKMNMQNRFDAQGYNCNTLQAIDKLGDRIEGRLSAMEAARIREQLDMERARNAALQGAIDRAQLRYDIVNDVRPGPVPAYITCNPYAASYGFPQQGYGYGNNCGCGCGAA